MRYFCCDELRRNALKDSGLNGIDYLEVLDHDAATPAERQRKLFVHFVNTLAPAPTAVNIVIEGDERIRPVNVAGVTPGAGSDASILTVEVDRPGDFSIYTLRVVEDALHLHPPPGYDPILSAVDFSFKVECPSDFDCKPSRICPPEPAREPDLDYLARDYATFRRLLLDRMAVLKPAWKERNPADLGVALVELLAFVGDYLSYQQDAVATEAYLGTARRRVSVRRHAKLVDYDMHDGCNARAWVQVEVSDDVVKSLPTDPAPVPRGTRLLTRISGQSVRVSDDPAMFLQAQVGFETMQDMDALFLAHNRLLFYTWSDQRCCLPKGATGATLSGHFPHLQPGDVLIFEEVLGPYTGEPEDADPSRQQAVRLTQVVSADAAGDPLKDPLNDQLITEIVWATEDALAFAFCISAVTDEEHGHQYNENVSIARGNIVLVDHGLTMKDVPLPDTVPSPTLFKPPTAGDDRCQKREPEPVPPRYRPQIKDKPPTQAAPYLTAASAAAALHWDIKDALPEIVLESVRAGETATWKPQRDLLSSDATATEFVVEIESNGTALLRFGDDRRGKRPESTPESPTRFTATYRVGNGVAGNIGAEALVHIVSTVAEIVGVRNPLPAHGGMEPETMEDVRQRASSAFRTQERAVTQADYAEMTQRHAQVQRSAATFRWTGSWHTVFLTVDRVGGLDVDDPFETDIRRHVERYRMAGYDVEVDGPRYVPLELEMHVCIMPDYFRSDVKAALLQVFSNRTLPNGRPGVFHPDRFTFGQPVYLSPLYAAAQAVDGVASVHIKVFQRQRRPDPTPLIEGMLPIGRLEIAQLNNDPNFIERGVFRLTVEGGK